MSDFDIYPFAREREIVIDAGYLAAGRHIIYGLVEVDVTRAREMLRDQAKDGKKLSFTAFVVASLGRAIAENPRVQAYRDWRGRLVVFRDVDVVTLIEPRPGGAAIPHIIRGANRRPAADISAEIRAIQARPASSAQQNRLVALAPRLPRFVRMLFFWAVKKSPQRFKELEGTVTVTAVGMFGSGGGWGIAFLPTHTMGLTVGGIVQKPGVHEGRVAVRDYLQLTVSFDHDIVDGAPAARFTKRLVELLETASVLEEGEE
ncbi:MAG: 2-oxo acid dehydrogenase subunit E2 [Candidatus Promineifilaceae bacterium]|jgi:pyruvate/2-oxoglutarate dehydrogenase complex dihydrolipoamide acyltransferase (E2) component